MFRTIQSKLFITYSTFILVIITAFTMLYYMYTSKSIEEKASESLYAVAFSLNAQLDSELSNMESIITKIWYSQTFKDLYFSNINSSKEMERQRSLRESVFTALGPDFPVSRVTIYHPECELFSVGLRQEQVKFTQKQIKEWEWVKKGQDSGKKLVILPPHSDEWMKSGSAVISLCKSADTFGKEEPAVIEVQQDYGRFIAAVEELAAATSESESSPKTVLIYDRNGNIIFPYTDDADADNSGGDNKKKIELYQEEIKNSDAVTGAVRIMNPSSKEREVVAFHHSELSGWTVTVAESEKSLLSSVTDFRNTTLMTMLLVLICTMILSYFVSKTLTTPINKILKNMKRLSLEALPEKDFQVSSSVNELEELNQSFSDMCAKLKVSLDEIVLARSHEIQARLLALQAQMNPHFLYNTIANISIMAEDNDDTEVVDACRNLSSMLRFISSKSDAPITIRQELAHTECFINLMKIRHEDALSMEVRIPENMMDIQIPKLVFQPLVENCTKYAIHTDPPWKILIVGECTENSWNIQVSDNGPGFDEAFLCSLREKLKNLNPQNPSLDLSLGGMGLINIYVRLKLLYGEDTVFELYNLPQGGAGVRIGGFAVSGKEKTIHE